MCRQKETPARIGLHLVIAWQGETVPPRLRLSHRLRLLIKIMMRKLQISAADQPVSESQSQGWLRGTQADLVHEPGHGEPFVGCKSDDYLHLLHRYVADHNGDDEHDQNSCNDDLRRIVHPKPPRCR